jgi:hypothetical protein
MPWGIRDLVRVLQDQARWRRFLGRRRWPIEIPRWRAFCLNAPTVRLSALEMSVTGVLFLECFLSSLSSCADQPRRETRFALVAAFLAILSSCGFVDCIYYKIDCSQSNHEAITATWTPDWAALKTAQTNLPGMGAQLATALEGGRHAVWGRSLRWTARVGSRRELFLPLFAAQASRASSSIASNLSTLDSCGRLSGCR